jgi:hypothetical protein
MLAEIFAEHGGPSGAACVLETQLLSDPGDKLLRKPTCADVKRVGPARGLVKLTYSIAISSKTNT